MRAISSEELAREPRRMPGPADDVSVVVRPDGKGRGVHRRASRRRRAAASRRGACRRHHAVNAAGVMTQLLVSVGVRGYFMDINIT